MTDTMSRTFGTSGPSSATVRDERAVDGTVRAKLTGLLGPTAEGTR